MGERTVVHANAGASSATPPPIPPPPAATSTQRVIRGALILLSTQPVTWTASLLLVIFIPRLLDSRSLGEYQMAISLSSLLAALVSLGVPTVLTRRLAAAQAAHATDRARIDILNALVLLIGLGLVAGAASVLLVGITGVLPVSLPLLAITMFGLVLMQGQFVLFAALTGFQLMGRYAWTNAASAASTAALSILALSLGGGSLGLASAGIIPMTLVMVSVWRRLNIGIDPSVVSRPALIGLATMGLPFLGWDVLIRVRHEGEALVLGTMLSVETVGWWSAALRVVSIPIFVPTLIVTPLLPALSQILNQPAAFALTVRRSVELTLVVTVGISAGIFAFAPIVPTVLGWSDEYQAAVPLMQLLVSPFPLVAMGMVLGAALVALGRERQWLVAMVAATVTQYALLWLTVPLAAEWYGNGALGAAFGRMAAEVVMLGAAQLLLPRGVLTAATWLFAARVALAGIALVAAVNLVLPLVGPFWPAAGVAGVLIYVVCLFVLRTVRMDDVRVAAGLLTERLRRR